MKDHINKSRIIKSDILGNQSGLTLVELLVVVVLLGLIFTVIGSSVFSKGEAAKAELNLSRMNSLKQEISRYRLTFNSYPRSLQDLVRPNAEVQKSGRLFSAIVKEDELQDLWGNPYVYRLENDGRSYSLTSFGSDGVTGGEGPGQDVTVRP
ncbi:MAG TPA: type II secretion system protein GspG [Oligoflexia bacterium]|nr:type II secretion system protein GspG [Oligoflexia bacterium]HMP47931.1 type II secretion system protein GspG [Oligoflexia bacterium]